MAEELLFCSEDASNVLGCFENEVCEEEKAEVQFWLPKMEAEEVLGLFDRELEYVPGKSYVQSYRSQSLDIEARQKAIAWILKVHRYYAFGAITAYRSVNYLDRFLSKRPPQNGRSWMMQLLSVACLSLAAKMEETQVPLLLDLQTEGPVYVFESRTVQRMELLVLSALDWRMLAVTPFSFVDYFLDRGSGDQNSALGKKIGSRTSELILGTHRVIEFAEHKPSAVAAGAIICAVEELLTSEAARHWKESILSCKLLRGELVWKSYGLMQEALIGSKSSWSSIPHSPVAVLDAFALSLSSNTTTTTLSSMSMSSLYASVAAKRRKLGDQNTYSVQPEKSAC